MSRGEIQHIFEDIDADGSGTIDIAELDLLTIDVGFLTKIIDGACACNFDDGSMPFPVPDGATEISDRLTVGPVTDGNLQVGVDCYPFLVCYIVYHSQFQITFL